MDGVEDEKKVTSSYVNLFETNDNGTYLHLNEDMCWVDDSNVYEYKGQTTYFHPVGSGYLEGTFTFHPVVRYRYFDSSADDWCDAEYCSDEKLTVTYKHEFKVPDFVLANKDSVKLSNSYLDFEFSKYDYYGAHELSAAICATEVTKDSNVTFYDFSRRQLPKDIDYALHMYARNADSLEKNKTYYLAIRSEDYTYTVDESTGNYTTSSFCNDYHIINLPFTITEIEGRE